MVTSIPSTLLRCTAVAGDMADSPNSETPGLVISNPAEFTFRKAAVETEGKGGRGRVKQAPSYNNVVDRYTVLTKTAGRVNTKQLQGEGGINTDRVPSYQVAGIFSRPFTGIAHPGWKKTRTLLRAPRCPGGTLLYT